MPGRTAAEAVNNYLELLSRAISCVSRSVLDVRGGYYQSYEPHTTILAGGSSVRLPQSSLAISVLALYELIHYAGSGGPWEARTAGYYYSLENDAGQEIISYHWHPGSAIGSVPDYPHLHLGAGSGITQRQLQNAHVPTGYISLADFLQLVIADFKITPLRSDWSRVLEEARGL